MLSLLVTGLHKAKSAYADWRRRQVAFEELSSLDDRSLADIGITRSDIPYLFSRDVHDAAKAQATGLVRKEIRRAA
jgi:uncharacterized protein YjiS (DUF1127 family)